MARWITRGVCRALTGSINSALYGTPSVDNKTRYYNLLGWTFVDRRHRRAGGTASSTPPTSRWATVCSCPVRSCRSPHCRQTTRRPSSCPGRACRFQTNQVWPRNKVENHDKQGVPRGAHQLRSGAPRVDQTIYLTIRPLGADWFCVRHALRRPDDQEALPEGFTSEFVPPRTRSGTTRSTSSLAA